MIGSLGFVKVMGLLNLKCHCGLVLHIGQFNLNSMTARGRQQLAQRVEACSWNLFNNLRLLVICNRCLVQGRRVNLEDYFDVWFEEHFSGSTVAEQALPLIFCFLLSNSSLSIPRMSCPWRIHLSCRAVQNSALSTLDFLWLFAYWSIAFTSAWNSNCQHPTAASSPYFSNHYCHLQV